MQNDVDGSDVGPTIGPEPKDRSAVFLLVLMALVAAGYANTLGNTALAHHVPDPYRDAVLDNTMLASRALLPKLFTHQFLLATYGEYRPVGYTVFALINTVLSGEAAWHAALIGVRLLTVVIVFVTLRMLVGAVLAGALSAALALQPLLVPLVNDVNLAYLAFGLLFTVATVWLFLLYLRRSLALYLVLSLACFALSVFTYSYALVAPAFLIVLQVYHRSHPRVAAMALVYIALAAGVAALVGLPAVHALVLLSLLALGSSAVTGQARGCRSGLARSLPAYLVVVGLFFAVSSALEMRPVHQKAMAQLTAADMIAPYLPTFVAGRMLTGSVLAMASALAALLAPGLLLERRGSAAAAAAALVLLLVGTVYWNGAYRDDLSYWQRMSRLEPDRPVIQLNLAKAKVSAGQYEEARDALIRLGLGTKVEAPAFRLATQTNLGKAFAGLGEDKLAGYFLFSTGWAGWEYRVMKNLLMDLADFSMRTGYLSNAEYCWSSGLVLDPFDVRLHRNLGKVLMYRNFYRAAQRYLEHALDLAPDDADSVYYLAFIAQAAGDEQQYARCRALWESITGDSDFDFQPVYDAYRFDREQMRAWFSENPVQMLFARPEYATTFRGETYRFWEVPVEFGQYFSRQGDHARAAAQFSLAYEANPRSREVVRLLAEARRKLGQTSEAQRLEAVLEALPDEAKED